MQDNTIATGTDDDKISNLPTKLPNTTPVCVAKGDSAASKHC